MDAHEREAAAAAEGMQELYGRPEHAVGDSVTFQLTGWMTPKVGTIEGVSAGSTAGSAEYLIRSGDRAWLVMDAEILNV